MTAHRHEPETGTAVGAGTAKVPASVSRRKLLGGAAVALPTILTLRSGTLAAASFTGTVQVTQNAPADDQGRMLCIDPTSTEGYAGKSGKLKLGDPPMAHVNAIHTDHVHYYQDATGSMTPVTPTEMCYRTIPEPYYHVEVDIDGNPVPVEIAPFNNGGFVSAAAFASATYAGGIFEYTEI